MGASPSPTQSTYSGRVDSSTVVVGTVVLVVAIEVVDSAGCGVDDDTGTSVVEEGEPVVSLAPPHAAATRPIVNRNRGTLFRRMAK